MTALTLLIPGGTGQLGRELNRQAQQAGADVRAPGRAELDVTSAGQVVSAVRELAEHARRRGGRPVVINAAAYTAVDAAESAERKAFAVNADGPRLLAAACASAQVPLIHVSTDYVFSGESDRPYEPDDPLGPRSAYGRTKAAGEVAVLASGADAWVVRTAWVYGVGGSNFVHTIARLEREKETLRVVDDQHGSPTSAEALAGGLLQLAERIADGQGPEQRTLHCTCQGSTTWFGFARAIFEELDADPERVQPCSTQDFPRPAPRPARAVLSPRSWLAAELDPMPAWREALAAYVRKHRDELRAAE
ncbi:MULTISPECIES: dTDP-4-dehydrorhamnose reductase [Thermocrispum]|uniref:dTDP-4-dehydrorhamnose reductase n=1 Tax=Thermocrispum agreste TaxID=37925 RepID=A0ABD6FFJ8_9PSEU|nr:MULTISPECIES: dTDP-4-dehydrorhamnose reductase [Thermocrispum]